MSTPTPLKRHTSSRRKKVSKLDAPVLGLRRKSNSKGVKDEDYAESSSAEDSDDKLQLLDRILPKVTSNLYTDKIIGEPMANYYSTEPTLKYSSESGSELESNAKGDLVLMKQEYRAKAGQQNVKLGDILTVPMQRILKYHLLLKQRLDNTTPDDPEFKSWDGAYEGMKDVSDYVNEGKRDHELSALVQHIKSVNPFFPQGDDVMQFGRLLQDGQFKLTDSTAGLKVKTRYAFLFEKALLIFKNKNAELCGTHLVSNFKIVEPEHESQLNRASNTLSRKLTISLFDHTSLMVMIKDPCVLAGEPPPYLEFIFTSTEKRNMWRKMLENAIDRNVPISARRLRHKVVYQSYLNPTVCSVCNKLLLGLYFQGYHCQTCNQNMHYGCLDLGQPCRHSSSTSLINRSNSNGSTHILMQPHKFEGGDRVQAIKAVISHDSAVLNFQEGDVIEIIRENEDGLIIGRLINFPARVGLLSRDSVKRISRNHSMSGNNNNNSPQQSPMRTIDPNVSRLSVSHMVEPADRRPSLVSSKIIDRYENIAGMTTEMYPWYFGELERHDAKLQLGNNPDGTFLVRKSRSQSQYVLSVLYKGTDKHILIELDQKSNLYFVHGARYFHDIPALIKYYRNQSLDEGFTDLFTQLRGTPLRQTMFRAVHLFNNQSSDSTSYLRLDEEDFVRVLDTNGEENGWWKGISKGVTGFFPLAYVEEMNSEVTVQIRNEAHPPTEFF